MEASNLDEIYDQLGKAYAELQRVAQRKQDELTTRDLDMVIYALDLVVGQLEAIRAQKLGNIDTGEQE